MTDMENPTPAPEAPSRRRRIAVRVAKELLWIAAFVVVYWIVSEDQAPRLEVRAQAPAFTAERIGGGGEPVEISPAVAKPKVLVFWAPWCKVCAVEMPFLGGLQEDLGDGAVVVGVGLSGSRREMERFVREKGAGFPHVYGDERMDAFGVRAFPTIFVLDAQNRVKARFVGFTTALRIQLAIW